MTYEEFEKRLSEYPANFGLKGHPGKIFMISFSGSWANPLVDEDNPEAILLAIDEMLNRNSARSFADMTEEELREQIITNTQETQPGKFTLDILSVDFEENVDGTAGLITVALTAAGLEGGASVLEWSEWVNTTEDGERSLEKIDTQDSCGHNDAQCWDLLSEGEEPAVGVLLKEIARKTLAAR